MIMKGCSYRERHISLFISEEENRETDFENSTQNEDDIVLPSQPQNG